MKESISSDPFVEGKNLLELKSHYVRLAKELSQKPEGYLFPGMDDNAIERIKAADDEYPGYATPIGEIIEKMKAGVKVVLGDDPEGGNVFVLPVSSTNIEMDSVLPRLLEINSEMDDSLRSLIITHRAIFELSQKTK